MSRPGTSSGGGYHSQVGVCQPHRVACLRRFRFSALPPSNPACPSPLLTQPLPLDLLHTPRLSTHGLHIVLPHLHGRYFLDMVIPRLPLPLANYSCSEVVHTTIHGTIYMCSQHGISPQISCRPVERCPAHVVDMVPRSTALSFWFGAGGRISVANMCKIRAMMTLFIFSTSACRIF